MNLPIENSNIDHGDFYLDLRRHIHAYFSNLRINPYANATFFVKALIYFGAIVGGYYLLIAHGNESTLSLLASYMIYMIGSGLLIISVAHDASHKAVSQIRIINSCLAYSWNLLGISRMIWEIKHHQSHHINTNLPHRDVDIKENALLRFSPEYTWYPWHRYQYLYAPVLYLLYGPFQIFVKDFLIMANKDLQTGNRRLGKPLFVFRVILMKAFFIVMSLIIPIRVLVHSPHEILFIYLLSICLTGFILILILAVPHINESGIWVGPVPVIRNRNQWALLQVHTTADSSPESVFLGWITGGLNTHLIHHLFPNICHIHYRALTPVLRSVLEQHGLPYHSATAWRLLISHFSALRTLGSDHQLVSQKLD